MLKFSWAARVLVAKNKAQFEKILTQKPVDMISGFELADFGANDNTYTKARKSVMKKVNKSNRSTFRDILCTYGWPSSKAGTYDWIFASLMRPLM
jgi:hypothetical protein